MNRVSSYRPLLFFQGREKLSMVCMPDGQPQKDFLSVGVWSVHTPNARPQAQLVTHVVIRPHRGERDERGLSVPACINGNPIIDDAVDMVEFNDETGQRHRVLIGLLFTDKEYRTICELRSQSTPVKAENKGGFIGNSITTVEAFLNNYQCEVKRKNLPPVKKRRSLAPFFKTFLNPLDNPFIARLVMKIMVKRITVAEAMTRIENNELS